MGCRCSRKEEDINNLDLSIPKKTKLSNKSSTGNIKNVYSLIIIRLKRMKKI